MSVRQSPFEQYNTSYALEKISDFIRGSGSGADPSWAGTAASQLITALQKFEQKLREANVNPAEHGVPRAMYAANQLKKLVERQRGDLTNNDCAEVFLMFMRYQVDEMRNLEREIDAPAQPPRRARRAIEV